MENGTETITLNIEPFLMPLSIIISAVVLATGFVIGMNSLNGKITTGTTPTTTTATDTTTGTPATGTTAVSLDTIKSIFQGDYITFGDANSSLLFVEVSDPSCPYCHVASGKNSELNKSAGTQFVLVADGGTYVAPVVEMKKLVDEGKAAFAWIYTNGHGNGEMGTKALYCAHEQGKFWSAHDLLMTAAGYSLLNDNVKNDASKSGDLSNFLSSVVDSNALKSCLDAGTYDSKIVSDQTFARSIGVQGTPGFFVNATSFPGAYNWIDMQSAVGSV